jgi:hypothetical protein
MIVLPAKIATTHGFAMKADTFGGKLVSPRTATKKRAIMLIPGALAVTSAAAVPTSFNTPINVQNLATLIMSEASIGVPVERTAVGYTVINRMIRNGTSHVSDVWRAYAHNQQPSLAIRTLAAGILQSSVADPSSGATHYYSPLSMPKEGTPAATLAHYDVKGGLELVPGESKKNYRPGWALTYLAITIAGVRPLYFKFYKAPGSGPVR